MNQHMESEASDREPLRSELIWKALARTESNVQQVPPTIQPQPKPSAAWSPRQWMRWRMLADAAGGTFWVYLTLQLFVFDVGENVLRAIALDLEWVIDYRGLLVLGLLAVVAAFFWRLPTILTIIYVLLSLLSWSLGSSPG